MKPLDITVCDCRDHREHAEHHAPHPLTGRLVCAICHPVPADVKVSHAMQRFIDMGGRR